MIVADPGAVAMLAPMSSVVVVVWFAVRALEIFIGLAGLVATPGGRPESVICAAASKPLFGAIEIVTACGMPPCVSVIVEGLSESAKSAVVAEVGGGVSGGAICVVVPPPQAETNNTVMTRMKGRDLARRETGTVFAWAFGTHPSRLRVSERAAPPQLLGCRAILRDEKECRNDDEEMKLRTAVPPWWSKQGRYLTELFMYMSS